MFKFVQNCTYLIFLLIQALKILDGGGGYLLTLHSLSIVRGCICFVVS